MDAERRVLLVDLGLGIVAIASGLVSMGPGAVDVWWIGGLVAVATAVLAWSEEHEVVGGWTTIGLVLAFGLAFVAIGYLFGSDVVANVALPVAIAGLGVGLVGYRGYFGLVRPVPDRRLRRIEDRTV